MKPIARPYRLVFALLVLAGSLLFPGCGGAPDPIEGPIHRGVLTGDAEAFRQIVATLCDDVMEGRDAGTRGIDLARDYLVHQYAEAGLRPGFTVEGRRTYTQAFELVIGRDAAGEAVYAPISNIGGLLPGAGDLADQVVVIGAHYDHIGYGDIGSRAPERRGEIHPGADDNASGTAGLLILARRLVAFAHEHPGVPRRAILFTSFAGEERGLHGSRFETENAQSWPFELEDISGMINMDMIGRLRDDRLYIYTAETGEQWADWVSQANARQEAPLALDFPAKAPGDSDHSSFIRVGVPAVFFFSGLHAQYHTPDDVPETLNNEGAARILGLVGDVLERVATDPEKIIFVTRPLRPYMGVTPENWGGQGDGAGVVLAQVFADTPAAAAGLQVGDRLIHFGGREIASARNLSVALRNSEAGKVYPLVILRGGEEVELRIELGGR